MALHGNIKKRCNRVIDNVVHTDLSPFKYFNFISNVSNLLVFLQRPVHNPVLFL